MPLSYRVLPLARLLSKASALDSGLPYNWNWQRRWTEADDFLTRNPIIVMDVGARGPAPPELDSLRSHVQRVGFEPDADECRRLNAEGSGRYFPTLIARSPGRQTLNLYRDRSYSSILPLGERFQRLWSGPMPLDKAVDLEATNIDSFVAEHSDLLPDLLKLDTQGTELDILEGAERTLGTVGLVEVEVEFTELYEKQPLFNEVSTLMTQQGFELLYLNRVMVSRQQVYRGPSRGQVLYADALYGKREDRLDGLSPEKLAKYIILLCQYGHLDIAWQLLQEAPAVKRLVPQLPSIFGPRGGRPLQAALMQLDKVLAVAMHLRRYNQRGTDCDRSWPIR